MDQQQNNLTALTVDLLSAFVSNNSVSTDQLAGLIQQTHAALAATEARPTPAESERPEHVPAVSVRKSLGSREHIISMIDGKPYKTLRRHLATHGLTDKEYRERYNLPSTYPMVAPAYADSRREIAVARGLGRKPKEAAAGTAPTPAANQPAKSTPSPALEQKAAPKAAFTTKRAAKAKATTAPATKKARATKAASAAQAASAVVSVAAAPASNSNEKATAPKKRASADGNSTTKPATAKRAPKTGPKPATVKANAGKTPVKATAEKAKAKAANTSSPKTPASAQAARAPAADAGRPKE